jgi:plastocyanin
MNRTRMLAASLAALGAGVIGTGVIGAGAASAASPKLTAVVADPLVITLTQGGKKVSKLKAGTYTIVVADRAGDHNFHLKGPGVDKSTSVSARGTTTWKVTLKKGSYTFVCDPHASFMKGSFTVS